MPRDPLDEEQKSGVELRRLNSDAVGFTVVSYRIQEPLVAAISGPFVLSHGARLLIEVQDGFLTLRLEDQEGDTK